MDYLVLDFIRDSETSSEHDLEFVLVSYYPSLFVSFISKRITLFGGLFALTHHYEKFVNVAFVKKIFGDTKKLTN